jgi:hypothetical protein
VFERSGVRLSAAIMTHPSRLAWAEQLRSAYPELGVVVVQDPDPTGPSATMRTARLAWQSVADGATHHLVLQDDVLLCAEFPERTVEAILGRPADALSLFVEWAGRTANLVRLAALTGHGYVETIDPYVPTQALVLPADVARGFLPWADENSTHTDADDVVMLRYLAATGVTSFVTAPNLVDHDTVPSLLGNSYQGTRRATWFEPVGLGPAPDGSALVGLLTVPFMSFSNPVGRCLIRSAVGGPWSGEPPEETLRRQGIEGLAEAHAEALALPQVGGAELCERFGRRPVRGVWTTAVAIGMVAAGLPVTTRRAADPAARERSAMITLARGGLRMIGDQRQLDRLAGRFGELSLAGLDYGRRATAGTVDSVGGAGDLVAGGQ